MKKPLSLLATLLCFSALFSQEPADTANRMKLGDSMPGFVVGTLDGKQVNIADYTGKVVLLNFFATWCGPCMKELPELQKDVYEKYRDRKDFVLLVIGREETAEKLIPWIPTKGFDLPFFPDPKRDIYKKFASAYIPRNYLFNKEGKLVYMSKGFVEEEFGKLKEALAKLME